MRFSYPKLSKDQIGSLRRVSVRLFPVFTPMTSPVYIFLTRNKKFVGIKAPLGFFTPEELKKFRGLREFYLPAFVDQVAPFQRCGQSVRKLLDVRQRRTVPTRGGRIETIELPTESHGIDDAVLTLIGPLWGPRGKVEPFFVVTFANEVCGPMSPEALADAVDQSVDLYELAMLRACFSVLLALHLGWHEVEYLTGLRNVVFDQTVRPVPKAHLRSQLGESWPLVDLVEGLIPDSESRAVTIEAVAAIRTRTAAKLRSRLFRVRSEFLRAELPEVSIFGQKGFVHGG